MDDKYRWQDEFKATYYNLNKENFTLVACPGAGKTLAVLRLARELMETGIINFLWIVCPTRQVKKQWSRAAAQVGLEVEWNWKNEDGALPADMDGVAVTYAQVISESALHSFHVGQRKTLVVMDEIHHAEDDASWGVRSKEAFSGATRRILLTGTPWRSNGTPIAFAEYDAQGYVKGDYVYNYDRAQSDFICRPIFFPDQGGIVEWKWGEKTYVHDFQEVLSDNKRAQRLRAAVSSEQGGKTNEHAAQLLANADAKLSAVRAESPTAGGLVLARDISHANALADYMQSAFGGPRPTVIASDDPLSLSRIDAFRNNTDRWLVAVEMVSEGVDIPRLQVLAYLSTTTRALKFNQAAGRICRGTGEAFFLIPDDPLLLSNAERIADLRRQALTMVQQELDLGIESTADSREGSPFQAIGGTPVQGGVIFSGHRIERDEYTAVQLELASIWPGEPPHEVVGKLALAKRGQFTAQPPEYEASTRSERKEQLKEVQNRLVRTYCMRSGEEFKDVNYRLNQEVGVAKLRLATEEQLTRRLALAKELYDGRSNA